MASWRPPKTPGIKKETTVDDVRELENKIKKLQISLKISANMNENLEIQWADQLEGFSAKYNDLKIQNNLLQRRLIEEIEASVISKRETDLLFQELEKINEKVEEQKNENVDRKENVRLLEEYLKNRDLSIASEKRKSIASEKGKSISSGAKEVHLKIPSKKCVIHPRSNRPASSSKHDGNGGK